MILDMEDYKLRQPNKYRCFTIIKLSEKIWIDIEVSMTWKTSRKFWPLQIVKRKKNKHSHFQ